eukprot:TRINITY_DN516_c0_g1_i1.p1 TRINITY_DN516_c0_g1~~TRINITY_DN516_c0_g1_i1.p1  ORF type:complete len:404 (-),score=79.91 TRINITY_DN516_c0_g1_i1:99-1310(-)
MNISLLQIGEELITSSNAEANQEIITSEFRSLNIILSSSVSIKNEENLLLKYLEMMLQDNTIVLFVLNIHYIGIPQFILDKFWHDPSCILEGKDVLNSTRVVRNGGWVCFHHKDMIRNIVFLPALPSLLKECFRSLVLPKLKDCIPLNLYSNRLFILGITECEVDIQLTEFLDEQNEKVTKQLNGGFDGTDIVLSGHKETVLDCLCFLKTQFNQRVLPPGIFDPAEYIIKILHSYQAHLGVVESCTGGMLMSRLISIPGSGSVVDGCVVAYSNKWKRELLDVKASTLTVFGPISQQTIHELLAGMITQYGVQVAVATSGVAGPGPFDGIDQGTVFIGVRFGHAERIEECHFKGGRDYIRNQAVSTALCMLMDLLLGDAPPLLTEEKEQAVSGFVLKGTVAERI